jgi:rfaE bifunctional protein nucleotidyltransferase chain/domain
MLESKKIQPLADLAKRCTAYRKAGRRVVWTNGCFDLVHAGHVVSLEVARALGDILVVGLNSDVSVHRLKGEGRPFMSEANRLALMAAFSAVDYVVVFDSDDCCAALRALQPDVYAQGGGYTLETIHQEERAIVEGYGGHIAFLPNVEGESTTTIVERIRRSGSKPY